MALSDFPPEVRAEIQRIADREARRILDEHLEAAKHEPWLTKRELADRLGVSVRTIERLKPPQVRVGNQNRYLLSKVQEFLRRREAREEAS